MRQANEVAMLAFSPLINPLIITSKLAKTMAGRSEEEESESDPIQSTKTLEQLCWRFIHLAGRLGLVLSVRGRADWTRRQGWEGKGRQGEKRED
jgi:hypothetical protein